MPSAFTQQLIDHYGPPGSYRYNEVVMVKQASSATTAGVSHINRLEPWSSTGVAGILQHHPVAWWDNLSVSIQAMPGVYGRMCTFYGGWASAGTAAPTSIEAMLQLQGSFTRTWGGTGDPGTTNAVIPCTFNATMSDVMKTPYNEGVRPVFYYFFLEVELIDKAKDSDRFLLHFNGTFDVQGKY